MSEFSVFLGGKEVSEVMSVTALSCHEGVNQIPSLTLRLSSNERLTLGEGLENLKTGAQIEVRGGFDEKKPIFNGLITEFRQGMESDYFTEIIGRGDIIKLADGPVTVLYKEDKAKDTEIIKGLCTLRGITLSETVDDAKILAHPHYLVYQQTPWRAVMNRVLANGLLLVPSVEGNALVNLDKHSSTVYEVVTLNSGITHFHLCQDVLSVFDDASIKGWNIETQACVDAKGTPATFIEKLAITTPGDTLKGFSEVTKIQALVKEKPQLGVMASAELTYRTLDRFQGKVCFYPNKNHDCIKFKLLDILNMSDFGASSGKYLISGINHRFSDQGWHIEVSLGLHLNHSLYADWANTEPIPQLIGVIADGGDKATDEDQVSLVIPTIDKAATVWARLLSPFASKSSGIYFPANVGDEVVVGFVGGDGRFPIILGATHNPKNPPPIPFNEKEKKPGIYFGEQKLKMEYDLKTPVLTISAGKAALVLADEAGPAIEKGDSSLTIGDKVLIKSKDDLQISAGGIITVNSDKGVTMKISDKVDIT